MPLHPWNMPQANTANGTSEIPPDVSSPLMERCHSSIKVENISSVAVARSLFTPENDELLAGDFLHMKQDSIFRSEAPVKHQHGDATDTKWGIQGSDVLDLGDDWVSFENKEYDKHSQPNDASFPNSDACGNFEQPQNEATCVIKEESKQNMSYGDMKESGKCQVSSTASNSTSAHGIKSLENFPVKPVKIKEEDGCEVILGAFPGLSYSAVNNEGVEQHLFLSKNSSTAVTNFKEEERIDQKPFSSSIEYQVTKKEAEEVENLVYVRSHIEAKEAENIKVRRNNLRIVCHQNSANLSTIEALNEPTNIGQKQKSSTAGIDADGEDLHLKCQKCNLKFHKKKSFLGHMELHGEKFRCEVCNKVFPDKRSLSKHYTIHDEERFQCDHCDMSFTRKEYLERHSRRHAVKGQFKCKNCSQTFAENRTLQEHIRIHEEMRVLKRKTAISETKHVDQHKTENFLKCEECGKTFSRRHRLNIHRRLHTGERPFQCGDCCIAFRSKSYLKDHVSIHNPFKCLECGKLFTRKRVLVRHVENHAERSRFMCKPCDKPFLKKRYLARHVEGHGGEKPFGCEECGRRFQLKEILKKHLRIHTGERPFRCHECGASFGRKCVLVEHMKLHLRLKPFCCDRCGKSFRIHGNLSKHLAIHSGVRPFKCDKCERAFFSKVTLKLHIMRHVGERPFLCDKCSMSFVDATTLRKHMRSLHSDRAGSLSKSLPK